MTNVDTAIGQRAKVLRGRKGITPDEMAQRMGVSVRKLSAWEAGVERMGAAVLFDYTRILELPVSKLFEWNGERLEIAKDRSP